MIEQRLRLYQTHVRSLRIEALHSTPDELILPPVSTTNGSLSNMNDGMQDGAVEASETNSSGAT